MTRRRILGSLAAVAVLVAAYIVCFELATEPPVDISWMPISRMTVPARWRWSIDTLDNDSAHLSLPGRDGLDALVSFRRHMDTPPQRTIDTVFSGKSAEKVAYGGFAFSRWVYRPRLGEQWCMWHCRELKLRALLSGTDAERRDVEKMFAEATWVIPE